MASKSTIAINNYECYICNAPVGVGCSAPDGKALKTPHQSRINRVSDSMYKKSLQSGGFSLTDITNALSAARKGEWSATEKGEKSE
jgi:hypothetical protein